MSCCTIPKSTKGFLETKADFSQYENQLPTYDELKEYVKNTLTYCFKNTSSQLRHEYNTGRATIVFSYYKSTIKLITVWPGNRKKEICEN